MTSQPLVTINGGNTLATTSLDISHCFGRKHKTILDAINNLQCSQEFARQNFLPSSYNNSQNKPQPMYTITRDGFVFLCMGFTGPEAAIWKERYIKAFNDMEEELIRRRVQQAQALPAPEEIKRLETQVSVLRVFACRERPVWRRIMKYRDMGLTQAEIAKLVGMTSQNVRENLKQMDAVGLVEYKPNPRLIAAGSKGRAIMMAKRQGGAQ